MTASYWFDVQDVAEPAGRAFVLRALDGSADGDSQPTHNDDDLTDRVRRGDPDAFSMLYQAYATGLLAYATRLCGSRSEAQDIVAELFKKLWDGHREWRPRSSIRAYLYTAVRHGAINAMRDERRAASRAAKAISDPTFGTSAPPVHLPEQPHDPRLDAVWRVIDGFPPLRRQVMYLRWARDLRPEEIAAVLGINSDAVYKHLSRAMQGIRAAIPEMIRDE